MWRNWAIMVFLRREGGGAMKWRLAISAVAFALSWQARAEWLHTVDENPFTGDGHIAMALEDLSGYGAGFRCTSNTDATLIFATPERISAEDARLLSGEGGPPVDVLVVVDDQPKLTFPAKPDVIVGSEKLRFISQTDEVADLIRSVMMAKRRVALAVQINGQVLHTKSFSAAGSTKALSALIEGCHINPSGQQGSSK